MRWDAEIETSLDLLKRIVALLLSLANLAERTRGDTYGRRRWMLSILRPAEIVAWKVALRDGYGVQASPELIAETFAHGDSPDDAKYLAVVLRALAMTLIMRFALYRGAKCTPHETRRAGGTVRRSHNIGAFAIPTKDRSVRSSCLQAIPP